MKNRLNETKYYYKENYVYIKVLERRLKDVDESVLRDILKISFSYF